MSCVNIILYTFFFIINLRLPLYWHVLQHFLDFYTVSLRFSYKYFWFYTENVTMVLTNEHAYFDHKKCARKMIDEEKKRCLTYTLLCAFEMLRSNSVIYKYKQKIVYTNLVYMNKILSFLTCRKLEKCT